MIKAFPLLDFFTKPQDIDVQELENTHFSYTPINNTNYQPLKGA